MRDSIGQQATGRRHGPQGSFRPGHLGGPSHAPLDERLQHGRRAARRRSAGRALGSLVAASVVVAGAATVSTGQDRATEPASPAVAASPAPTPTLDIAVTASEKNWEPDEWARMNPRTGELHGPPRGHRDEHASTRPSGLTVRGARPDPGRRATLRAARAQVRHRHGRLGSTRRAHAAGVRRGQAGPHGLPADRDGQRNLDATLPLVGYGTASSTRWEARRSSAWSRTPSRTGARPTPRPPLSCSTRASPTSRSSGTGTAGAGSTSTGTSRRSRRQWAGSAPTSTGRVIEQGERDRKELEREVAEREQSDRR